MHYRKTNRLTGLEGTEELPQPEIYSYENKDQLLHIFTLVGHLPQKQKDVFLLREVEEMSYEEIAKLLEMNLEQVKINLHRARKNVREKLISQGIHR